MIRAIVVGLGKQSHKHTEALKAKGCEFIVGVDPNYTSQNDYSNKYNFKTASDCSEISHLLPDINLAVICTPVLVRKKIIKQLLDSGVTAFVIEKPLALTLCDCNFFISIEKKYGAKIYVNYTYRITPPYYQLKLATIYKPHTFDFGRFYLGAPGNHQQWKHLVEFGGGAYNELGVHMQDLANYLLGPSTRSFSRFEHCFHTSRKINGLVYPVNAPDLYTQSFTHPNSTSLVISDFLSQKFSNKVVLNSTNMTLELEIGKITEELKDALNISEFSDDFNVDSYGRLYDLIHRGDPYGLLHRPIDTLNILKLSNLP